MAIDPKDMVDYAKELLGCNNTEIEYRNIINRAYYGAFLVARVDAKRKTGREFSGGGCHKELVDYYKDINSKLSNNLDVIRRLRGRSDYDINENFGYSNAKDCCKRASKIISCL